jgi:sulfite reductase (ferredoxin)
MTARPKSHAPGGVEGIKEASDHLRGTLAEQLHNATDSFDESGKQLLKFHGLYQQDDRDQRKTVRTAERTAEKTHSFMLRTRVPGGLLTAEQYLAHDDLAEQYANGTLRITTRQCFQFHGILKGDLQATVRGLNDALITSLGACGDVVRNVGCCPAPFHDPIRQQIQAVTREISDHLLPRTRAYHELWIDGEQVELDAPPLPEREPVEPIYGKTYLPRKFKIAVAYPGDNCVDVYTQDIGLVAIAQAGACARLQRHRRRRYGDEPHEGRHFPAAGRPDRLHHAGAGPPSGGGYRPGAARLRQPQRPQARTHEVPAARTGASRASSRRWRSGWAGRMAPAAPMPPLENELHHGWHDQGDGRWFLGLSVENGRIKDEGRLPAHAAGCAPSSSASVLGVRLTPNQDILLTDIAPRDIAAPGQPGAGGVWHQRCRQR